MWYLCVTNKLAGCIFFVNARKIVSYRPMFRGTKDDDYWAQLGRGYEKSTFIMVRIKCNYPHTQLYFTIDFNQVPGDPLCGNVTYSTSPLCIVVPFTKRTREQVWRIF